MFCYLCLHFICDMSVLSHLLNDKIDFCLPFLSYFSFGINALSFSKSKQVVSNHFKTFWLFQTLLLLTELQYQDMSFKRLTLQVKSMLIPH